MDHCRSIELRLRDEIDSTRYFCIDKEKLRYYEPSTPIFGNEFAKRFQTDGLYEVDEAGKCLAFGRPTACVFHLMRIMEIGVHAVSRCLGIPDPIKPSERNWGKMLSVIWKEGIEKRWPTPTTRVAGDGELFEAIYASLDAVKNPWRNSTMHVENKYTDDEAEHIFIAVRAFMKKVASRMDESGQPLA